MPPNKNTTNSDTVENGKNRKVEAVLADDMDDNVSNLIPTPPDGGWGWVIVGASLMCNIIVDGIAYAFGIFLPEFVTYFGESRSKVSLIGSLLCGIYLCAGPIVGALTNKFGCRPVTIAGSIVATIAFILATFSPNIDILILTYGVLGGIGFGMIYLPSIVSVGYYFERRRAIATGIAVCGSGIGTFIFAPLTKFLLDQFHWKNALYILAGIVFNGAVCGALMRPLEPTMKTPKLKELKTFKDETDAKRSNNKPANTVLHNEKETVVFVPKISVQETGTVSGSRSDPSTKRYEESRRSSSQDKTESIALPHGVEAHEVQPLIKVGNGGTSEPRMNAAKRLMARPGGSNAHVFSSSRSISSHDYARPMYKKDIFYSGSIRNIHQFKSQPDVPSYIASITSIPTNLGQDEPKIYEWCSCLPKPIVDVLHEMCDVSLLKNVGFMCICLGNVFAMCGYFIPYVYIVDRALMAGIDKTQASFLLSVIGITNTIGRVVSGVLADFPSISSLLLNNICMLIASVAIVATPFCNSYVALVVVSCVFGLTTAAFISLTSVIICDLLGLEKLTNAFGLLTLARGISSIVGPPIAGAVFQSTGNYDASFFLGGGVFFIGALLHFVLFLPGFKENKDEVTVEYTGETDQQILPKALESVAEKAETASMSAD